MSPLAMMYLEAHSGHVQQSRPGTENYSYAMHVQPCMCVNGYMLTSMYSDACMVILNTSGGRYWMHAAVKAVHKVMLTRQCMKMYNNAYIVMHI